jgi:FtsP/CotA-like multicopper oxidase with cupredoxin domain
MRKPHLVWLLILLVGLATVVASAQSFRVQCPSSTISHPAATNDSEPTYSGPTTFGHCTPGNPIPGSSVVCPASGVYPATNVNGAIKCQQISGGDGYSTMADGTQTYMFSFGPLSGLTDIANGQPGTQPPSIFNSTYPGTKLLPGDPATTDGANDSGGYLQGTLGPFSWNGAVGLIGDPDSTIPNPSGTQATGTAVVAGGIIEDVTITNPGGGYNGPVSVTFGAPTCTPGPACETALGTVTVAGGKVTGVNINFAGEGYTTTPSVTISAPVIGCTNSTSAGCLDGHVDPRQIMDIGVMNGNIPAPLMAMDEDDEFFLTLTNVGMIMRPDLFEQHTVHFHGYPNASSFYDGVPDASVAINIGGSFTYYYLAPDAGTYFWHCHITPPEHLQMGMVGQLYVRPRQNRVPSTSTLYAGLQAQQNDNRTKCDSSQDILCSNPLPAVNTGAMGGGKYAYNDGDGSTRYDVEYPLQIHGFDPNFHFVGMTFNPEGFADMKDKYFLLNGRGYPDTVSTGPQATMSADGAMHYSQPLNAIINIPAGGRALLRISDLDVSEYQTLASLGIPMTVVGYNAKLLRDQEGNNLYYNTNSITLGGGESLDVILDASNTSLYPKGSVFFLYTPNLDHLSNDAENFGGLMTEVHIN